MWMFVVDDLDSVRKIKPLLTYIKNIQNLYVLVTIFIVDQEGTNLNLCSSLFDRWILKAGQVLNRETTVHKISFVILRFTIGAVELMTQWYLFLVKISESSQLLVPAAHTPETAETASACCFYFQLA